MADEIRPVEYYSIALANRPGEGARVLTALKEAGVNLIGCWGYPAARKTMMDIVPEQPAAFSAAARKAKIKIGPRKQGFHVTGEDRIGAVAELFARLGDAGVNISAAQAIYAGAGRYGMFLEFEGPELRKAKKVLA
jgi:hypothetical protein